MTNIFHIRRLDEKDITILFDLFSFCITTQFPEYTQNIQQAILTKDDLWSKKTYQSRLKNPHRILLGAFSGEKLVGFLDALQPELGVSMGVWLMTHPDFWHQGIAKQLLQAWEKIVSDNKGHMVFLYAPPRNKNFYTTMGFALSGKFQQGWFGLENLIFSKIITKPQKNFL